jgi:hypothetical protein
VEEWTLNQVQGDVLRVPSAVLFLIATAKDKSMTDEQLIAIAREAAAKAYAPYSNFRVGAAVASVDGAVVTGANMENACYRLGLCAEQSAHAVRRLPPGDPRSSATQRS